MKRRDFLKAVSAAGVVSMVPGFAGCRSFGGERLKPIDVTVDVGIDKPFTVLHVTDSHLAFCRKDDEEGAVNLSRFRSDCFGGRQREMLEAAIAYAEENGMPLLHTGDLVDFHSQANFEYVRDSFAPHCALMSAGNHELSRYLGWEPGEWKDRTGDPAYRDFCAKAAQPFYPFDLTFAARTINGVNFIAFDDSLGWIPDAVFGQFEAEVKKDLPIVLLCHMPLYAPETEATSVRMWGENYLPGSPKLASKHPKTIAFVERLRSEPLVKAVLAGDLHATVHERFSPTAMQYTLGGGFEGNVARVRFVGK